MKKLAFILSITTCTLGSAHAANALGSALQNCINANISNNHLTLLKSSTDGSSETSLDIKCYETEAKGLFNEMQRFTTDTRYTFTDGSKAIVRTNRNVKCWKNYLDAFGDSMDSHYCLINIDMSNDMLKAIDL